MSPPIRWSFVSWSVAALALAIPFGAVHAATPTATGITAADADPAAAASSDAGPLPDLDALRCWARGGHACATSPDALGKVEDAFPRWRVLGWRPNQEGAEATILRYRQGMDDGVVFLYQLDRDGKVQDRRCVEGLPAEGTSLAYARFPDQIEGQRLIYWDRCTLEGACRSTVGRRVVFGVDAEGRLVKQGELGPGAVREKGADSIACLFPQTPVRLPSGQVTVASLEGRAWMAGSTKLLVAGQAVEPAQIFLDTGSSLLLSVAGTTLRFQSDSDLGLRLDLRQDPALDEVWRSAASLEGKAPLTWADPYLFNQKAAYEVVGAELRKLCELQHLRTICTNGCLGFRRGSGPVVADGAAYFPGPGPVTAGRCR